jgi:hypothetical protein
METLECLTVLSHENLTLKPLIYIYPINLNFGDHGLEFEVSKSKFQSFATLWCFP